MDKYKVHKFFKSGRRKLVASDMTLEEAKLYCKRKDTRKEDSSSNIVWFCGFTKQ